MWCLYGLGNIAGADALLRHAASSNDADIQIDQFADGTTPLRSYIGPETLSKILVKLAYIDQTLPSEINIAAPNPVRMGALADAAGLSWRGRRPGNTNGRTITLDTERLSGLLSIPQCASQPTEMVAQLKQFNLIG